MMTPLMCPAANHTANRAKRFARSRGIRSRQAGRQSLVRFAGNRKNGEASQYT